MATHVANLREMVFTFIEIFLTIVLNEKKIETFISCLSRQVRFIVFRFFTHRIPAKAVECYQLDLYVICLRRLNPITDIFSQPHQHTLPRENT
jgi:hypothetical protein